MCRQHRQSHSFLSTSTAPRNSSSVSRSLYIRVNGIVHRIWIYAKNAEQDARAEDLARYWIATMNPPSCDWLIMAASAKPMIRAFEPSGRWEHGEVAGIAYNLQRVIYLDLRARYARKSRWWRSFEITLVHEMLHVLLPEWSEEVVEDAAVDAVDAWGRYRHQCPGDLRKTSERVWGSYHIPKINKQRRDGQKVCGLGEIYDIDGNGAILGQWHQREGRK